MSAPEDFSELNNLTLITGGARSGKSAYAESIAKFNGGHVVYIATMNFGGVDGESALRINRHKARRPEHWQTIEEPIDLASQISRLGYETKVCLIDCLSLWVANLLPQIDLGITSQGSDIEYEQIEKIVS